MSRARTLIIILMLSLHGIAHAATRTTIITEVMRGNNSEKRIDIFTVDANRARLDMHFGEQQNPATTSTLLTVDGGRTWYLSDPKAKKTVCTAWNTKEFFKGVGELILYAESLVGADVSEGKFEVLLDEPGPEMLGYKTRHLKLHYSLNAVASVLFIKREYRLEFYDEVWVSPELKLSDIEQSWVDAMSDTGYAKLDHLSKQWNDKAPGTVIKMISDVNLHNITKDKKREKQERMHISKIENIKSEELAPDLFKVPSCEKVSQDEMEEAAKEMLTRIAK